VCVCVGGGVLHHSQPQLLKFVHNRVGLVVRTLLQLGPCASADLDAPRGERANLVRVWAPKIMQVIHAVGKTQSFRSHN
jgi:hypothetical protein